MWSNDDAGCVQRTTQTGLPLPLPEIDLTQFSSTVSGNIGANTAGVTVAAPAKTERTTYGPGYNTDPVGALSVRAHPIQRS